MGSSKFQYYPVSRFLTSETICDFMQSSKLNLKLLSQKQLKFYFLDYPFFINSKSKFEVMIANQKNDISKVLLWREVSSSQWGYGIKAESKKT